MINMILLLAGLVPFIPAFAFISKRRQGAPAEATRKLAIRLSTLNIIVALMVLGAGTVWFFAPAAVNAAQLPQEADGESYRTLAAALAVGAGSIGAAYAVSSTGSAAVGAIAEKPEVFGRALIFVGLAEGVAIYGLIIAFMILGG